MEDNLNNTINKIDLKVDKTVDILTKIKGIKIKVKLNRFVQSLVVIAFGLFLAFYSCYYIEIERFNNEYKEAINNGNKAQTVINVRMNNTTNKLDYSVDKVNIHNTNGQYTEVNDFKWLKSDIDTDYEKYSIDNKDYTIDKKTSLKTLVINDEYVYIEYANSKGNANKEMLLSCAKPIDVDTSGLQSKTLRFYEKSNPIAIKSYTNSFNDSFLMMNESLGGGELSIKTLKDTIDLVESNIKVADNKDDIILKLEGLQDLNLNQIKSIGNNIKIEYNSTEGVMKITGTAITEAVESGTEASEKVSETEKVSEQSTEKSEQTAKASKKSSNNIDKDTENEILISDINNKVIGSKAENFLETNLDNVFISKKFDDESSSEYNTFAVLSGTNLYTFKTSDREMVYEILKGLGITPKQIVIDKVQSVIEK